MAAGLAHVVVAYCVLGIALLPCDARIFSSVPGFKERRAKGRRRELVRTVGWVDGKEDAGLR